MTRFFAVLVALSAAGCAHDMSRELAQASRSLGRSVGRADGAAVVATAAPGMRAQLDGATLLESEGERDAWSDALSKPTAVEPTAVVFLRPDFPVAVVQTADGWRFAEDPTDVYAQDTPRHALRALVWASRAQRWDVVLRLAPMRYRMGLSEDDLQIAWTEGEYAQVLTRARDAVADHLGDPIVSDVDEAVLEVAPDHRVRLERERDQWVIVDFLGSDADDAARVR